MLLDIDILTAILRSMRMIGYIPIRENQRVAKGYVYLTHQTNNSHPDSTERPVLAHRVFSLAS